MPSSIGQHHDGYIKAYLDTGSCEAGGQASCSVRAARGWIGHSSDSFVGVEASAQGKKTFIATLRRNTEKANSVPSKVELDAMMHKAVETTLQEATTKIKDSLSGELASIMKRLEDYQASHKLLSAKALKDGSRVRFFFFFFLELLLC
jgi:tRNA U34 5-methylaminomethyl-2-thiouridine-forming methyltransferase MnmC